MMAEIPGAYTARMNNGFATDIFPKTAVN